MKKVSVIVFCLALLFVSFTATIPLYSQGQPPDEVLRNRIIGRWGEGDVPYGVVGFGGDGVYRMWVYDGPRMERLIGQAKGAWRIEGGRLHTTISETSPALPPADPDEVHTEGIFDITDTTLTLIDGNGAKYTKARVGKRHP